MDDTLFEKMLQEIDAMTTEEYWSLYREAEQLANFPPDDFSHEEAEQLANFPPDVTSFIQIQFVSTPVLVFQHKFNNTFGEESISISHDYCQEAFLDGDDIWLKAA